MAVAFRSKGAYGVGTTSCTAAAAAGIQDNDILLIVVESSDSTTAAGTPNTPSGWTKLFEETQGGGATGVTTLTVFGKRASGAQGDVTIDGVGNHCSASMFAYSGCKTTGDAWTVGTGNGADTGNGTMTGLTTPAANCMVLMICCSTRDANNAANWSSWANANLTSLNEREDNVTNTGAGGGFGVNEGLKATAGATGNSTVTIGVSAQWRSVHIALEPAPAAFTLTADSGAYTLTGTAADLDTLMPAASGSYAITGTAAGTSKGFKLAADSGVYGVAGQSISNSEFPVFFGFATVNGSLGAFTPGLPACTQKGDYQLVIMETADEAITVATANGFTEHPASPISVPNADPNIATRMTIYERLWDGSADIPTLPSFNDAGDHIIGTILVFRPKAGLEWTSLDEVRSAASGTGWAVSTEAVEDTSGSAASLLTDEDDMLIVGVVVAAKPDSSSVTNLSGITNSNLNNITEIVDRADATGNGGMIGAWTGEFPFKGDREPPTPDLPIGTTAFTLATAAYKAILTLALYPGPRELSALLLNCPFGQHFINGDAVTFRIGAAQAVGAYGITGTAATLTGPDNSATLTADPGAYAQTGTVAEFDVVMPAAGGAYGLTGTAATLVFTPAAGAAVLTALSGAYSHTGAAATLAFTPVVSEDANRNWLLERQSNPHWRFLQPYRRKYKRGGGVGGVH